MFDEDALQERGAGTLGASEWDPYDFHGVNDRAYLDEEGRLHGLPDLDVLGEGLVACAAPAEDGCFYLYAARSWPGFVAELAEELASGFSGDAGAVARMRAIVEGPRRPAELSGGAVAVPLEVLDESGVAAGSDVVVVGECGYFSVWGRDAYHEQDDVPDLFGSLFLGAQ